MERTGERTYERALPRRFLRAGRGQGAQTPPPRPAPPPPLSSSATKSLTDADHFGMIRTAQRRFAPTVIGITRNSDRHQIGMSDRHRRNTQSAGSADRIPAGTTANAGPIEPTTLGRDRHRGGGHPPTPPRAPPPPTPPRRGGAGGRGPAPPPPPLPHHRAYGSVYGGSRRLR